VDRVQKNKFVAKCDVFILINLIYKNFRNKKHLGLQNKPEVIFFHLINIAPKETFFSFGA